MGGLFHAARAAQAEAGDETTLSGNDTGPLLRTAYEDDPASEPLKSTLTEVPSSSKPAFTESQALPDDAGVKARGDQSAPRQEEYRAKKESALPPGPFDNALAEYKEQRGIPAHKVERSSGRGSPFGRFGADTEENPLRVRNEAAPKLARQQLALNNDSGVKADSYAKYEAPSGSEKAPGFGQPNKPQEQNADPVLHVAQNIPRNQIPTVTPDGFKKHPGEIWIEGLPKINAIIEREAKAAGVNPRWLKIIAYLESSGNPNKENGSYQGLFQFDPRVGKQSWEKYGKGNIKDATDSTRAMIRAIKVYYKDFFEDHFREPTLAELFAVHNQGRTGSSAHLGNLDGVAWENLVRAGARESVAKERVRKNVSDIRAADVDRLTSRGMLEYKFAGGTGYGKWYMGPAVSGVAVDNEGKVTDLSPWTPTPYPEQNNATSNELSGEEARRLSTMREAASNYFKLLPTTQPKRPRR